MASHDAARGRERRGDRRRRSGSWRAARVGLYSNLGHAVGPAVFLEALRPVEVRRRAVPGRRSPSATSTAIWPATGAHRRRRRPAHVDIDQVPVPRDRARARRAAASPRDRRRRDAPASAWAETHILASPDRPVDHRHRLRARSGAGAEVGLPLKPGRLVLGLRYLWIDLGTTSQGDDITGNSAGLIGDIGYKMTF